MLLYAKFTENEKPQKRINTLSYFVEIIERVLEKSSKYRNLISVDYRSDESLLKGDNFILQIFRTSIERVKNATSKLYRTYTSMSVATVSMDFDDLMEKIKNIE